MDITDNVVVTVFAPSMHLQTNIICYRCTVCNARFRLQSELKQHYPSHYINGDAAATNAATQKSLESDPAFADHKLEEKQNEDKVFDRTITITFNGNVLNKNGIAGDITINIDPAGS